MGNVWCCSFYWLDCHYWLFFLLFLAQVRSNTGDENLENEDSNSRKFGMPNVYAVRNSLPLRQFIILLVRRWLLVHLHE